jgi:hypothetical protein
MMGADMDVTAITAITGWVGRSRAWYADDEQYMSFNLANQLNHRTDVIAGGARFRLTPLTTILIAAEFERERFERSSLRDANGMRLAPAIAFDTGAVITGDLKAGFRSFRPLNPSIASFRGFAGAARLHYALPSVIRIDLEANRDIEFSYDPIQPYYLESGARVTVTQRIIGPFEVIGIGQRWAVRNQRVGTSSFDGRREVTTSLGGGVGLQFQRQVRFAFTVERTERTSTEPVGRNYERTRVLGSFYYGL